MDTKTRISRNSLSAVKSVNLDEFCTIPPAGHALDCIGNFILKISLVL